MNTLIPIVIDEDQDSFLSNLISKTDMININSIKRNNDDDLNDSVKYGCNGKIKKKTEEYKSWRDRNNAAIKRCRSSKKDLPELREKLRIAKEEENRLIGSNKILLEEKEKLEKELKENFSIDMNSLMTKQEFKEIAQLLNELNSLF